MDKQNKQAGGIYPFLMLTLILSEQQCQKFVRVSKEAAFGSGIIVLGRGTIENTLLNLLGIKSQNKEIIHIFLEKDKARDALDFFTKELQLNKPGYGIAYTTPLLFAGRISDKKLIDLHIVQGSGGEDMYKKLTVVVNRGLADDVMDIARKAGVKGGTIMHGRGAGTEFTAKLLGVEIEPEKELVMMLMPGDLIDRVAEHLYQELKLDVPGNGILFVEPVTDVRGLFGTNRDNDEN